MVENKAPDDAGLPAELRERVSQELVDIVAPEQRERITTLVTSLIREEGFAGPLPHPRHLAEYEATLPGLADRLVSMTEREQAHRHQVDTALIKGRITLESRGQFLALAALVAMLIVVGWIAYLGHAVPAATLGTTVIAAVVGMFLTSKFLNHPENSAPGDEDEGEDGE